MVETNKILSFDIHFGIRVFECLTGENIYIMHNAMFNECKCEYLSVLYKHLTHKTRQNNLIRAL